MISHSLLYWLGLLSSAYILVPLLLVTRWWQGHDAVRRRVGWYIIFNATFSLLTFALAPLMSSNLVLFYLASPLYIVLVYRIFDALVVRNATPTPVFWQVIRGLVVAYCFFVAVDMIWLENVEKEFSKNIYPPEKALIVSMSFYFLYRFSREARSDFSSLWIGLGIGINALLSLIILVYSPYISLQPNTLGDFVWSGLGSIITVISYSFVTYGLWIGRSRHRAKAWSAS